MGLRFVAVCLAVTALGGLAATELAGCAASGSQDTGDGLGRDGETGEGGAVSDEAGPSVFDAGPPAKVDNGDSGANGGDSSDVPIPDGGCASLAQCPYQDAANVEGVTCAAGACGITCNGETYDVNGDASDGCEIAATCPIDVQHSNKMLCPIDDHSENVAASVGSYDCTDSDSTQNLTGTIPSDQRDHSPAIDGFVPITGATPTFFGIFGTGGTFCQDDANFTLQMNAPTRQLACYVLTLITDNQMQTCNTDSTGACSISNGSGSYKDNSQILVEVSKAATCGGAASDAGPDAGGPPPSVGFPDDGTFTVTGHL